MFRSLARVRLVIAAGVILAASASAQSKVAVINLQRAVLETAEIKKASADLQAKFKPRTDSLQKIQQELQDLQSQLQGAQGKLSAAGEADLQTRATRKQREAERLNEDLQADVDRERTQILERAQTRMEAIIKKIAEEQGFDLIVDMTNRVYHKPSLEITDAVIAAYDKAYPVK
jgi:outer membrane protein